MRLRQRLILPAAIVVIAACSGVARAQDTSFNRVITLGTGLTNQIGTCNNGFQSIGSAGGTLSAQSCAQTYTSAHTVVLADGVGLYAANFTSGSTAFTLPRATGTADGANGVSYCFADRSGNGYTLTSAGAISTFTGYAPAPGATSMALQGNVFVCATSDGSDHWYLGVGPGLATTSNFGIVEPDGTTVTAAGGVITTTAATGVSRTVSSGTTDNATTADGTIVWNSSTASAKTETLPQCTGTLPNLGHTYWVKGAKGDENTNNITVQAAGGSDFDGGNPTAIINVAFGAYAFQCDGSKYEVLAYYTGNAVQSGASACGALQTDYSVSTGCNAVATPMLR